MSRILTLLCIVLSTTVPVFAKQPNVVLNRRRRAYRHPKRARDGRALQVARRPVALEFPELPFALPVLNVDVAGDGKNRIQLGGVQES